MQAALEGRAEIGFTVLSISVSLIAVFIPILMMGGIIGRLFREFAVVLSVTILVSLVVSLTTTPMMCSRLLKDQRKHGRLYLTSEKIFNAILKVYEASLGWTLRNSALHACWSSSPRSASTFTCSLRSQRLLPPAGHRTHEWLHPGRHKTPRSRPCSSESCACATSSRTDPGVASVAAFTGGGGGTTVNTGRVFISLKPLQSEKGKRRPDHQPASSAVGASPGRHAVSTGGSGSSSRGPAKRRAIPIHDSKRRLERC